ncbi:MAG: hypothetical protein IPO63_13160 [Bacteroidetes bacterium]|nr:hypothetical protein [Bacteroidota bacterium]
MSFNNGSSAFDAAIELEVDDSNNVYIAGTFQGTIDFDPGPNISSHTSNGFSDVFILKLDSSGQFINCLTFGGSSIDGLTAFKVDPLTGSILAGGSFRDTVDFDPGPLVNNLSTIYSAALFVIKLSNTGNLIFAKTMDANLGSNSVRCIQLDSLNHFYISGNFRDTLNIDPGASPLLSPNVGSTYIAKYNFSGNFIWVKQIGGPGSTTNFALSVSNNNKIYLSGQYTNTVDFDPDSGITNLAALGSTDIFIISLDTSGNLNWAKSVGGYNQDYSYSVVSDPLGFVYLTGNYRLSGDFDPGPAVYTLSAMGGFNKTFVLKLDSSGNFVAATQTSGASDDQGEDLILTNSGSVIIIGTFVSTTDFDTNPNGLYNLTATGSRDAYVWKLNQNTVGFNEYENLPKIKLISS